VKPTLAAALLLFLACGRDAFKETIKQLPEGGSAKDPETGVVFTFHQKNAGVAGTDGWYAAHSVPCGFRVGVPGPYNDFSQEMPATDGARVRLHVLGTKTVEGAKFTVSCTERSDGRITPGWAEDVVKDLAADMSNVQRTPFTLAGAQGIELRGGSNGTLFAGRFIAFGRRSYNLMVEYPSSEEAYMPRLVDRFFASFEPPR
jgi:hypothetical protein